MNEQSRLTGAGGYQHERGGLGWGHLAVVVASRGENTARLLLDGRYTDQDTRDLVATAWVWDMKSPTKGRSRKAG